MPRAGCGRSTSRSTRSPTSCRRPRRRATARRLLLGALRRAAAARSARSPWPSSWPRSAGSPAPDRRRPRGGRAPRHAHQRTGGPPRRRRRGVRRPRRRPDAAVVTEAADLAGGRGGGQHAGRALGAANWRWPARLRPISRRGRRRRRCASTAVTATWPRSRCTAWGRWPRTCSRWRPASHPGGTCGSGGGSPTTPGRRDGAAGDGRSARRRRRPHRRRAGAARRGGGRDRPRGRGPVGGAGSGAHRAARVAARAGRCGGPDGRPGFNPSGSRAPIRRPVGRPDVQQWHVPSSDVRTAPFAMDRGGARRVNDAVRAPSARNVPLLQRDEGAAHAGRDR